VTQCSWDPRTHLRQPRRPKDVEDQTGHHYRFPDRAFAKGDVFKLHSGAGTDTQTDLYWGASGAAIWNNDGDTVKVLDPRDQIMESFGY
jgi:hypothetical protein